MSIRGSTSSVVPQEAIRDLLVTADSSVWNTATPDVFLWQEKSQKERGPGQVQNPHLYVWQPTGAPLERLTAENSLLVEEPTVEIYVYSLDASITAQLSRDLIQYLSEFMSEGYNNTEYADIVPTVQEDFREQKITQQTDHYIYMVECEIQRETSTGVA